jgi:transposase-like protein
VTRRGHLVRQRTRTKESDPPDLGLRRRTNTTGVGPVPQGWLKQFTKSLLETALNEEMTEHLGHEKHQAPEDREATNVRNGTRPKTVLTEATGQVHIHVPRDRDGSFQPQIAEVAATAAERC